MKQSERDPARREKSGAAARTVKRTKVPARPAAKAAKQTKQTGRGEPPRKFRLMDAAKWTALCFLAALLIFSAASMARAHAEKNAKWENPYVDVIQSMWSYQYITELNKLGVYPDDTNFEPAASESRGGLAQALYKMDQNVFAPQREAQDIASKMGRICLFGGLAGESTGFIDSNKIHYKELQLCGVHATTATYMREVMKLIEAGKLDSAKYIEHIIPLDDIQKGFEAIRDENVMKVVVHP